MKWASECTASHTAANVLEGPPNFSPNAISLGHGDHRTCDKVMTIGRKTSESRRGKRKEDRNYRSKTYGRLGQLSLPGGLTNKRNFVKRVVSCAYFLLVVSICLFFVRFSLPAFLRINVIILPIIIIIIIANIALQNLLALDLRYYLVVKATEYDGGIHKFAFKLFKYGAHVDQHYFYCRTEHELMR